MPTARNPHRIFHQGELDAQARFGNPDRADSNSEIVSRQLGPELARFIESQPFFFLATSNENGDCDCSFRGCDVDQAGRAYPLLKVVRPNELIIPDYSGNHFFNSLGNILANPRVGLLFVDFQRQRRHRINGRASITETAGEFIDIWPTATRLVRVSIEQAYPNCRARIPRMVPVADQAGN